MNREGDWATAVNPPGRTIFAWWMLITVVGPGVLCKCNIPWV
jgi:hypothetical protein